MDEPREPMFNAPWPAVAITVAIIGGFGLQSFLPPEQILPTYGFSPAGLSDGRGITLITALFVHGSWGHALMNGAGALAFGTPVARYYGVKFTGALAFLLFYLVCGALANLGYGLVHAGDPHLLVGASGAVAGLMAAAARMIAGKGVPGPYLSPPVLGMTTAWVVVNLLIAVVGFAPGAGGMPVAWEAHLFGYAAGLVLVSPFGWLSRRGVVD
ncbi:rhomboid family intramembrane serine protease [Phenylobacterium sp. 20VBR1]|uniref:Rhomboid family intramembrane serine protease n=1 Tax=Phenylobacterium glaciei TaxID=2803784 RepID=A0A941HVQ8_9CAUL|nr:rhomboid family intramembrane serine protease [Phenylobacterium glaciei]MBR7619306.1 rhomboid family intramembrane serine protease [Phenylobacterium glaciei]